MTQKFQPRWAAVICFLILIITSALHAEIKWKDETIDTWHGGKRHNFQVNGLKAWVVEPEKPLHGKPWVWCMEFPDAFTKRCSGDDLIQKGYYYAHISVGNTHGCPKAVEQLTEFYKEVTKKGLSDKVVLIGLSRGGLYAYNWAYKNPEKVSVIYGDAPVCDFKSWPGGKGKGTGSGGDWQALIKNYGFKDEEEALAYKLNPIDELEPLAKAKVAIIHVVGDVDKVVPYDENTAIIEERYKALGGEMQVIHKADCDHHPHGLDDPTPVVDFIYKHTKGN